jgi:uncharacterized protein (DUF983 family)
MSGGGPETSPGSAYRMPSSLTMLGRGLVRACPVCGARPLFRWGLTMVEDCPRCALHFERIEGHWLGSVGLNTTVTAAAVLASVALSLYIGHPEFPMAPLLAVNVTVAVVVPLLFHASSRTLWTAIDVIMRPLEPYEVDWTAVRP